jgi:hypothetical protein
MWTVTLLDDPLNLSLQTTPTTNVRSDGSPPPLGDTNSRVAALTLQQTRIAHSTCLISELFGETNYDTILLEEGGRVARVALADYVARTLAKRAPQYHHRICNNNDEEQQEILPQMEIRLEPLDCTTMQHRSMMSSQWQPSQLRKKYRATASTPYVLERTDVAVMLATTATSTGIYKLHVYLRVFVYSSHDTRGNTNVAFDDPSIKQAVSEYVNHFVDFRTPASSMSNVMTHIATAVFQDKLRSMLRCNGKDVAFVANGAILPRKSGASSAPMASPPAIPFAAPDESHMNQIVNVDLGRLAQFIVDILPPGGQINNTIVSLRGLVVPRGVSLIVGGGYHGKSTLLRCLAAGIYNKVPGDGREFCVTVDDAVTVRAEDGRYVSNCNVSAFISNLPTAALDTQRFSTDEASGSTSQASNVVEAIEMGASAMLVDEDVSAANFMARDGRMRSLVMDESITPLLYRVNGLYSTHGISSIVVVGGVGDWLDVPNNVILMDRYRCHDATAKARSISKQFSHGHVQYAGRGVVHRLQWDKCGTPIPRRPIFSPATVDSCNRLYDVHQTVVTLLDGSNSIALKHIVSPESCQDIEMNDRMCLDEPDDCDDDDERYIDMSRCEQLLGKKPQLYGCGICVAWLLSYAQQHPELGICDLLRKLDESLDESGLLDMILMNDPVSPHVSPAWKAVVANLGYVTRPRRFEVGQALTRFRGIKLGAIPVEDDGSDTTMKAEAERKRNELIAIWNNRRKRNPE